MKIIGLKKAIGDFNRANAGGYYSPRYGYLMYDTADGELWTDEFYSLGRNSWNAYKKATIINLGKYMAVLEMPVTMANVKKVIEDPDFLKKYESHLVIK